MPRPDLTGYHLVNRGLRQEFGLLALAGRTVRSDTHRELIEDQLQLCLSVLQHLHDEQDSWLFPTLRERAPEGLPGLENLERDHETIARLASDARNRGVAVEERAPALQELHQILNVDLQREERDVVPLIITAITAADWQRSWRKVMNGIPGDQMPVFMGWVASATPEDELDQVTRVLPWYSRVLFRRLWMPAYQRRADALYR
jgi:hypothetical protein